MNGNTYSGVNFFLQNDLFLNEPASIYILEYCIMCIFLQGASKMGMEMPHYYLWFPCRNVLGVKTNLTKAIKLLLFDKILMAFSDCHQVSITNTQNRWNSSFVVCVT